MDRWKITVPNFCLFSYSVVVEGERGNRPRIYSLEQLLQEAVRPFKKLLQKDSFPQRLSPSSHTGFGLNQPFRPPSQALTDPLFSPRAPSAQGWIHPSSDFLC